MIYEMFGMSKEEYFKWLSEYTKERKERFMPVFVSRYTPGLQNGEKVKFDKGEVVRYRTRNGTECDITIDSEFMKHESGYYGYESIFHNDGKRCFAVAKGIVDWNGKQ